MAGMTDLKLKKLLREAPDTTLVGVGRGLAVQVRPAAGGGRSYSWVFRYQIAGKRRAMGLGHYPTLSLADASERAAEARKKVAQGVDPVEEQRAQEASAQAAKVRDVTFKQAALTYIEAHRAGWRSEKHQWQWKRTLEQFAFPAIGEKPVAEISTADVLELLSKIWRVKPETATRVRSRIELVLDAAAAQGQREGANPARWRGHLDKLLPRRSKVAPVKHQPAMPWRDLPEFWPEVAGSSDVVARALCFCILTAARTSEVLLARWSEIDFTARTWTVPAVRMKAHREHTVPLSDAAIEILRAQQGAGSEYIFPGRRMRGEHRPLCNIAMLARLRRKREGLSVHGFRSSFRDWAAEATHHPHFVAEAALAHVVADKVEAAYRRGDLLEKRRALMSDWASYVTGKSANNVIPFPKESVA
jgi:integrase